MKKESILKLIWLALFVGVLIMIIFPISFGFIRLGIVIGLVTLLISGTYLFWQNIFTRVVFGAIGLIVLCIAFLPGSNANTETLRNAYVESLQGYEGVKYIWGGENKIGIDCAALVREAYVDANIKVGVKTLNPKLVRNAFFVWWNDCGADALGNSYKGMTKLLFRAKSMDELDYSTIIPGDIIVAEKGFHTFAYIGSNTYIEADPVKGKVVKVASSAKSKNWKDVPIKLMRWSDFKN